jgi:hypothetical protein
MDLHSLKDKLIEGTFKYHMDKAIAANTRGDMKKKQYHLDNARTAKFAMKTADYAKNKELLDKHKEMSEEVEQIVEYGDIEYGGAYVNGRSDDALQTAKLTRQAKAAAKKAGKTFNTSAEYRLWHKKQKPKKQGVAEEAKIVHTRTGANGTKYHIRQDSANDYSLHREVDGKLKHVDTYGSLQRAKSVLDNEVKEAVEEGLTEMDKSQPSAYTGRDTGPRLGPDKQAKPITAKKATKDATDMLNRAVKDSRKKKGVAEAVHRIGLTVTDPNHPMVSKRKETIQKSVRVTSDSKEKAIDSAIAHHKRKGYKVHDHHYIGVVNEEVDLDEVSLGNYKDKATQQVKELKPHTKGEYGDIAKRMLSRREKGLTMAAARIAEVSSSLLDRYKDKAKKSADDLTASGQHAKSADRWSNVMKATGKQIEKTTAGIKKALNKEEVDLAEDIKKEYDAMKQHDIKTLRNMIKGQHKIVDTSEYRTKDHAISAYLRHKHGDKRVAAAMGLKEEEMDTRIWEAWSMGKRDPQKSIKVGQQVRSYDFPGMHDDHYIEGHVVGETPHSYHIRTSKVVRGGKDVPIPAHMGHVEAPKGKGMFNGAYAVHKIIAKQDSVAAQPVAAQGAAKTFAAVRGKK